MTLAVRRDPDVVTWTVVPPSTHPLRVPDALLSVAAPEHKIIDTVLTFAGDTADEARNEHEVRDYFDSVSVTPQKAGEAYSLTFRPRETCGPFWKDVMLLLVGELKAAGFQLRLEPIVRTADQPRTDPSIGEREAPGNNDSRERILDWLRRVGPNSKRFWFIAAKYSLDHERFTFEDLGRWSEIAVGVLRAGHRNTYRLLRRGSDDDPLKVAEILPKNKHVYSLLRAARDTILKFHRSEN